MRLIPDETLAIVTIYQEAAGEPYEGKVAVAEVIRNRLRAKYMSDGTVSGTVLRAYQFSGWNTDAGKVRITSVRVDADDPLVLQCRAAWAEAMVNGSDRVKGAKLYLNPVVVLAMSNPRFGPKGQFPRWAADPTDPTKLDVKRVVATIGRHVFMVD